MPTLAVVGAGPKGIAIAAKVRALAAVGLDAPHVVLVDRSEVAGNWSGRQGYTSGRLALGAPPRSAPPDTRRLPPPRQLGIGVVGGDRRDGAVHVAAAPGRTGRVRRLGRPWPHASDAPSVERRPSRRRRAGGGRGRRGRGRRPRRWRGRLLEG